MISCLQGKIIKNNTANVVLLTPGGVGYKIAVSPEANKLCNVGKEILLEVYLSVKEDAHVLYGFASGEEKELFKNFISVSGVGPKTALHLFELGSVEEITLAIGRGDVEYLTKVSGIGKKTAERIVVDLKSKVERGMDNSERGKVAGPLGDVVDALVALGYSAQEAREAARKLDTAGKTSEQMLKEALRMVK